MTYEEILKGLYDDTLVGNAPSVKALVEQGLEDDLDPSSMLYDALIPSLEEVGARFERGDYFVPEMLIAARAMQGALDILRPLLAETAPSRSARSSWAPSRATSTTSARTSATSCSRAPASPSSTWA
jgi:methanogenic corrinoid protein MtbC1